MGIGDKDLWEMFNKIKKGQSVNVGGKEADATQIRQIIRLTQQATQSIESHAIKALNQQIIVQENIAKRAEIREKKGQYGVPNIASLLTGRGAAGSTMGHIGRLQKMAEKPFKQQSEFYKFQEGHKEKMKPGAGFGGTRYRTEKEYETAMTEGAQKRKNAGPMFREGSGKLGKAGSGMNKLIGKVGKFMDSGKGQGIAALGMGGASIITAIIKKAMEASPMLQQMLKIMNVAMTLFLRPIGDFIGGMLKPIMLFFLKEVAVPMLRKGKDMIRIGETFGKGALGFLLKPIETIQSALNPLNTSFDGVKEWMTEQKLRGLAAEMEGRELLTVLNIIKNKDLKDETIGKDPYTGAEGYTKTHGADYQNLVDKYGGPDGFLTQFETIMTQGMARGGTQTYEYASGYFDNMKGGEVESGMGGMFEGVKQEFNALEIITGTLAGSFSTLNDAMNPEKQADLTKADIQARKEANEAWAKTLDENTSMVFADAQAAMESYTIAAIPESQMGVHTGRGGGDYGEMLSKFSQYVMGQMDKYDKGDPEYEAALTAYKEMTTMTSGVNVTGNPAHGYMTDDNQQALEGLMEQFPDWEGQAAVATEAKQGILDNVMKEWEISGEALEMNKRLLEQALGMGETMTLTEKEKMITSINTAQLNVDGYNAVKALIAQIASIRASQTSYSRGGGGSKYSMVHGQILPLGSAAIKWYQNAGVQVTPMQHGGMINEPIFGIGKSGQQYSFGEAGQEKVTPMFGDKAQGGGIGPVNINVNIEKVSDDVDLEKIKPIVERALQEVHARRGII